MVDPVILDGDPQHRLRAARLDAVPGDENTIWRPGKINYRITYSHGWDTGQVDSDWSDSDYDPAHVPSDIVLATLTAARRMYEAMGTDPSPPSGVRAETIGAYSVTFAPDLIGTGADLLAAERRVLDQYRI